MQPHRAAAQLFRRLYGDDPMSHSRETRRIATRSRADIEDVAGAFGNR